MSRGIVGVGDKKVKPTHVSKKLWQAPLTVSQGTATTAAALFTHRWYGEQLVLLPDKDVADIVKMSEDEFFYECVLLDKMMNEAPQRLFREHKHVAKKEANMKIDKFLNRDLDNAHKYTFRSLNQLANYQRLRQSKMFKKLTVAKLVPEKKFLLSLDELLQMHMEYDGRGSSLSSDLMMELGENSIKSGFLKNKKTLEDKAAKDGKDVDQVIKDLYESLEYKSNNDEANDDNESKKNNEKSNKLLKGNLLRNFDLIQAAEQMRAHQAYVQEVKQAYARLDPSKALNPLNPLNISGEERNLDEYSLLFIGKPFPIGEFDSFIQKVKGVLELAVKAGYFDKGKNLKDPIKIVMTDDSEDLIVVFQIESL